MFLDALPNNPHYKHFGHNWITKKWTVSCATCRRYVTRRQSWEAVRKVVEAPCPGPKKGKVPSLKRLSDSNVDASGRSRTLDAFFARVLPER